MATATYEDCRYLGGFTKMRKHDQAHLTVDDDRFTLRRPKAFVSLRRTALRIWARWSAVTALSVTEGEHGARLELTTKSMGTGTIELRGTTADDLWAVLDTIDDLDARFHHPPEPDEAEGEAEAQATEDGTTLAGPDESSGEEVGL